MLMTNYWQFSIYIYIYIYTHIYKFQLHLSNSYVEDCIALSLWKAIWGVRKKPLMFKNVLMDTVYNLVKICFAKDEVLLFFLYLSCTKECSSNIYEQLFINNLLLSFCFDATLFMFVIDKIICCCTCYHVLFFRSLNCGTVFIGNSLWFPFICLK